MYKIIRRGGARGVQKSFSRKLPIFRIIGHVAAALGPLACASRSARPRHVAAALGPLAYPSRSARPRKCLNLT